MPWQSLDIMPKLVQNENVKTNAVLKENTMRKDMARAQRITIDGYSFWSVGGGAPDEPAAPASPAPESAPAAPAAAPAAPASAPAGESGKTAPAAAAPASPAAPDTSATELAAFKALGLTPAEIARVVGAQHAREQQERAEQQRRADEWQRTPEGQRVAQRRQAMIGLLEETLGPDRLASLLRAAENFENVEATQEKERIEQSRTTMTRVAGEFGVEFKDATEKREFERVVAAHIQEDDKLNEMYFNRETREAAIREACSREAARINRILIAQGATDLKTAAAKRASTPRSTRGGSFAKISEFNPKSTNRAERKREWAAHTNSALDAVFDSLGL